MEFEFGSTIQMDPRVITPRREDLGMANPRHEHALLLNAPDPVLLDLAKNLLEGAGIPFITHGMDGDLAELGTAARANAVRPDLYVPHSGFERARALIVEAIGEDCQGLTALVEEE